MEITFHNLLLIYTKEVKHPAPLFYKRKRFTNTLHLVHCKFKDNELLLHIYILLKMVLFLFDNYVQRHYLVHS